MDVEYYHVIISNQRTKVLMTMQLGHAEWLIDTGERLETVDGKDIEIWEFRYNHDDSVLSTWAQHFRNQYCLDEEIDYLRKGYGYSRSEYLNAIKFPDPKQTPGPSIRSGDFGEILVADYLEFVLGYWVPRTRYSDKTIRNESTKGCDIIGFHMARDDGSSPEDCMRIFESKVQATGNKAKPKLQEAIDGSGKDTIRKAESLNAIKQRLYRNGKTSDADKIERFQNEVDHPYKITYGAAALFDTKLFDRSLVSSANSSSHPHSDNLALIVINGDQLMPLIHELYERAANEA